MKCPNCDAENPDYAFYCGKCSAQLRRTTVPEAKTFLEEDLMDASPESPSGRRKRVKFVVFMLVGGAVAALGIAAGFIFNSYLATMIWVPVEIALYAMASLERRGRGPLG